jgi:putative integral membrane protein (TIGR02587 family)
MTEVAIDSVEEMCIGLVIAAAALFLLGRITYEMPASEIAGRIVIEAMTVAIGVSVGTAQLGGDGGDDEGFAGDSPEPSKQDDEKSASRKKEKKNDARDAGQSKDGAKQKEVHFGGQLVLALCGAVLFAANVAPTEEVVIIAIEISWVRLMGLAIVSLLIGSLVLHYSEFTGAREFVRTDGFSAILLGTIITYAVSLAASALILWFFGRFDGVTLYTALAQIIVLGVAATLGASAGRLLLQ